MWIYSIKRVADRKKTNSGLVPHLVCLHCYTSMATTFVSEKDTKVETSKTENERRQGRGTVLSVSTKLW